VKRLAGIISILSGGLLVTVPHSVLPACEYRGFPRMHCSDTAQAVLPAGILLAAVGVLILVLKSEKAVPAVVGTASALSLASFLLPDLFGYCLSSKMPCNYGMVPAIKFIAAASGLAAASALIATIAGNRKKGTA